MSNNNTTRLHRPPPVLDMDGELTPELKSRCIEEELKKDQEKLDHEINDEWRCCCFKERTDARLIKYAVQMAVICSIIILCVVRLSDPEISCANANTFIGVLTLLIGIICPSPKIN